MTEDLAKKIVMQQLLTEAYRTEAGTTRSARIDQDERDLLNTLIKVSGIPLSLAQEAQREYVDFRSGASGSTKKALEEGERNETYGRYEGLCYLLDTVGTLMSRKEDKLFSMLTPDEYTTLKYLEGVRLRKSSVEDFRRTGLTLGHIAALVKVLEEGDCGAYYGFPIDDASKFDTKTLHPLEIFIPMLGKFMREQYNKRWARGFLYYEDNNGPMSALLYASLLSQAHQAGMAERGELRLDQKTRRRYTFTRDHLRPLLVSIFDMTMDDVDEKIHDGLYGYDYSSTKRYIGVIKSDAIIHDVVSRVLEGHDYGNGQAQMVELQHLVKLQPVYAQIAADSQFSDSEYTIMDRALEMLGIRRQDTRDLLHGVQRNASGNRASPASFDNLAKLYNSKFYRRHLVP